jgi:hypothetical protein
VGRDKDPERTRWIDKAGGLWNGTRIPSDRFAREFGPMTLTTSELAALISLRSQVLDTPRHRDPRRLTQHGYKVYSQHDEDGILAEIFRRIGTTNRTFVEFGVGRGDECNTVWLLMQGWSGAWIEANAAAYKSICGTHDNWISSGKLSIANAFITAETINGLISSAGVVGEIDLLSIDIDSADYWVWRAIEVISPRVVVVEYNATWAPPVSAVVPYDPNMRWNRTNYFGASLCALTMLGRSKGYDLVGCSLSGVNAFFVRQDLTQGRFLEPGVAEAHYEPPRYVLVKLPSGHPRGVGPLALVGPDPV